MHASSYITGVQKIAVFQAKALGDFIVLLPALQALRETYPEAELVYLGRSWHCEFLSAHPEIVDRVLEVPAIAGIRNDVAPSSQATCHQFFSALQREHFDIALHFQGDGQASNPFLQRLSARITAGMCTGDAVSLDRSLPYQHYHSEVLRALDVVSLIGASTAEIDPHLKVSRAGMAEVATLLSEGAERPIALLHPGADDLRRRWPARHFARVGDFLVARGFRVMLSGTTKERAVVEEVHSEMRASSQSLCGLLSLHGLAALLHAARLAVISDTGPLHLARAVGTSTVGIHWFPNLINWGPIRRTRHRALYSLTLACPECGAVPAEPYPFEPTDRGCAHLHSFVQDVPVESVCRAIKELCDL